MPNTSCLSQPKNSVVLAHFDAHVKGIHPDYPTTHRMSNAAFRVLLDWTTGGQRDLCAVLDTDGLLIYGLDELSAAYVLNVDDSAVEIFPDSDALDVCLDEAAIARKALEDAVADNLASSGEPGTDTEHLKGESPRESPGESLQEIFDRLMKRDPMREGEYTLSATDRLTQFLRRCCQKGHTYNTGHDLFPTHKRLAEYCDCSVATIGRICSGGIGSLRREYMDILLAIACVVPPPPPLLNEYPERERCNRMKDADHCLQQGPPSVRRVRDAIFRGIEERAKAAERLTQ